MKFLWKTLASCAVGVVLIVAVAAQTIGGNVSLAVTGTSGNIQLPKSTNGANSYGYALLEYGGATTNEIFYALGVDNTVTAVAPSLPTTQGSPALPANGVCIALGPNNWIAAITSTSTATLRVTQLNLCPPK